MRDIAVGKNAYRDKLIELLYVMIGAAGMIGGGVLTYKADSNWLVIIINALFFLCLAQLAFLGLLELIAGILSRLTVFGGGRALGAFGVILASLSVLVEIYQVLTIDLASPP